MEPENLLSQLRDVEAPDPISAWALAPGWWLLIVLLFVVIAGLTYFLISYWRKNRWRRESLRCLATLEHQASDYSNQQLLIEINQLLKRTLASAHNDRTCLQLTGQDWAKKLRTVTRNNQPILNDKDLQLLCDAIYTNQDITREAIDYGRFALWIRRLK